MGESAECWKDSTASDGVIRLWKRSRTDIQGVQEADRRLKLQGDNIIRHTKAEKDQDTMYMRSRWPFTAARCREKT